LRRSSAWRDAGWHRYIQALSDEWKCTLTTLAVQGEIALADYVRWLVEAAAIQPREPDNRFWTILAGLQFDLAQPVLTATVRQAFADDLPDPTHVALEDIEVRMALPPGVALDETRKEYDCVRDAGRAMVWLIEARNRSEGDSMGDDEADPFGEDDSWLVPGALCAHGPQDRSQRSLSLRQRQEAQEVLRPLMRADVPADLR
jgi:hypothetical protein